jgi:hypothetical protein
MSPPPLHSKLHAWGTLPRASNLGKGLVIPGPFQARKLVLPWSPFLPKAWPLPPWTWKVLLPSSKPGSGFLQRGLWVKPVLSLVTDLAAARVASCKASLSLFAGCQLWVSLLPLEK